MMDSRSMDAVNACTGRDVKVHVSQLNSKNELDRISKRAFIGDNI